MDVITNHHTLSGILCLFVTFMGINILKRKANAKFLSLVFLPITATSIYFSFSFSFTVIIGMCAHQFFRIDILTNNIINYINISAFAITLFLVLFTLVVFLNPKAKEQLKSKN